MDARLEAQRYLSRAARNYTPPGPPEDPWGPYVVEASRRFDVPERWIREVMRVESGGRAFKDGQPITSPVGAMGLMQVMPQTYDELRARYSLGDDPYDPHNSILAGAAYIREMYDLYGSPGFLAAYNAGPKRLDDYLAGTRGLPDETRRYVAMIGPYIMDSAPQNRSPAEQIAYNQIPIDIPPGTRFGSRYARAQGHTRYASATHHSSRTEYASARAHGRAPAHSRQPVEVAQMPEPPRPAPQYAYAPAAPRSRGGLHLIPAAMAEPLPVRRGGGAGGGHWAIQVGAYSSEGLAAAAVGSAREHAHGSLGTAHPQIGTVQQGRGRLYRARLTGLSRDAAIEACGKLSHGRSGCMVLSPDAQN